MVIPISMDCFCSKSQNIQCKIILLDEQELEHEVQDCRVGQVLLNIVFEHLNLIETAYFGLRYLDAEGQTVYWIDPTKKLFRQLPEGDICTLYFGVKFYIGDPCRLLEEITRYQYFLQLKNDVLQGRIPVSFELGTELGALVIQSELGDYDPRRHSPGYVSEFRLVPNQTLEFENKTAELHRDLLGQLPAIAELNYLDKVKWLEMYGVDLHPVLGEDNVEYFLGLTPSGIVVLRNKTTVSNYYWPRISKIYFKGRYFMVRVTDKNNDDSTYGFETPSRGACKHLWKCCVEHHAFFRLVQVSPTPADLFGLSSRFRYSGRTEKQAARDARLLSRSPPLFTRAPSRRFQRRVFDVSGEADEEITIEINPHTEATHVSIPQPAQLFDNPYQTNYQPPTVNNGKRHSDSPRSTRSAPWSQPHSRGLYRNAVPPSPRSVRSAGARYRSSSIDSQSSNESRSCRRRKHRSRMPSDNESELSKSSGRSHKRHRRHRSRGNRRDSSSEQDSRTRRHRSQANASHPSDGMYELVDSENQWRLIQTKYSNKGNPSNIQQATIIANRQSGYVNSGLETESEASFHNKIRKQKKHRSRSRSPETKTWLSDEFKRHLDYDLIDTVGMTESQLREIPYTIVQTNHAKQLKIKNWNKSDLSHIEKASRTPPPAYSQILDGNKLHTRHSKHEPPLQLSANNDFIRRANVTTSTSHALPRMLESLSISDISTNGSQRSNKHKFGNGVSYANPTTLLSIHNSGIHDNSESLRVSHEHTDSGLGAEQDYAYSSERSSDSAKYVSSNKNSEPHGSSTSVSKKIYSSEYKVLNPNQLYPIYNAQAFCRAEASYNAKKSTVHKQDIGCKYGLSNTSSHLSYDFYNTSDMPFNTGHKINAPCKHSNDLQNSFINMGSKHSNAIYPDNAYLTRQHSPSCRSSMRSISASPMVNDNERGPLKLHYRMRSSTRSKSSTVSGDNCELDNLAYTYQRTDTNKNINLLPIPATLNHHNATSNSEQLKPGLRITLGSSSGESIKNGDSSEMSTEL